MQQIEFINWSMRRPSLDDRNWYDWCLFANLNDAELATINSIEYTLHPTFPNPIRRTRDRDAKFAIFSDGWGIFEIRIRIETTEHKTSQQVHHLQLRDDNWPKPPDTIVPAPEAKQCLDLLLDPNTHFRWRKLSTIVRKLGENRSEIESILNQLNSIGLARRASFRSVDGQELWGATKRIGYSPEQWARLKSAV